MKFVEIDAPEFDLATTLDSGQVFHWEKKDDGFIGTVGDLPAHIEQRGDSLIIRTGKLDRLKQSSFKSGAKAEKIVKQIVAHYFALDHPLESICRSLPRDPTMDAAKGFCRGLRIIRQPKWECLATFICSSMKQVAHIRQISFALRKRFGQAQKIDPPSPRLRRDKAFADFIVYTFPSAKRIARSSEKELRECALGYRAKNLLVTARLIASGRVDLEELGTSSDADLREALCALPGVGAKVANCVMLFAYERFRAFPIDVWIERVLRENYFPHARKLNAARLEAFTQKYFGEHGGYAQQYLFHYARKNLRR